jgi:hypothetical protein
MPQSIAKRSTTSIGENASINLEGHVENPLIVRQEGEDHATVLHETVIKLDP